MKIEVDDFINKKNIVKNINQTNLKAFQIEGLFGEYTVKLDFDNKVNVFIGENGLGKTTILKCLYSTLYDDLQMLISIPFKRIILCFKDGTSCSLEKKDLEDNMNFIDKIPKSFFSDNDTNNKILKFLESENIKFFSLPKYSDIQIIKISDKISNVFDLPQKVVAEQLYVFKYIASSKDFKQKTKKYHELKKYTDLIKKHISEKILYFPTYRRIEFYESNYNSKKIMDLKSWLHFDMYDISEIIERILKIIRDKTMNNYNKMTGILLDEYSNNNIIDNDNLSNETIDVNTTKIILNRLEQEISSECRANILKKLEDGSIYNSDNFYLNNLLRHLVENYILLKKYDEKIKKFVDTCNNYFSDKELFYNPSDLTLKISKLSSNETLEFNFLSSGEKQIVGLFAELFLKEEENIIILIDEPELSLSLKWQRKLLLDIANSENCSMIVAMTHSPFIFDNEFDDNTREIHRNKYNVD